MPSTLTAFAGACLLLFSACGGSAANEEGTPASAGAEDPGTAFHGAWELASIVRYSPDGEELSRNEESTGFIVYDPAGAMGVVIQGADRQAATPGTRATPEERLAAYRSYTAYFGAFTVDPEAGAVTHHLRASMNPNAAGSDYVRQLRVRRGPADAATACRRGRRDGSADLAKAAGPRRTHRRTPALHRLLAFRPAGTAGRSGRSRDC